MNITNITARQIIDSRGNPTVEADVWCGDVFGRAAVPSGASTGEHEAHELRDGGEAFLGKGVTQAVLNIEGEIKNALMGVRADDQYKIDEILLDLDNTTNKHRLGANAMLAVSLGCAHAATRVREIPLFKHINDIAHGPEMTLPMPMMNLLNGGKHATQSSDFQEYMIVPVGAKSYREAVQVGVEVFQTLKGILHKKGESSAVGDEGGFAPTVYSNTEMLDLLEEAVEQAGYRGGEQICFALDVAASEFFENGSYRLEAEARSLLSEDMIDYLSAITNQYPVVSIEDGLSEDEWSSWPVLTRELKGVQIVGDDLLVTNLERLKKAVKLGAGNAILIKPNQIGTLTETIYAILEAKKDGFNAVVSHRSGETEDTTIAHIAVGTGAGQIKTGSISRGERTAKHNELMRIEDANPELLFSRPF